MRGQNLLDHLANEFIAFELMGGPEHNHAGAVALVKPRCTYPQDPHENYQSVPKINYLLRFTPLKMRILDLSLFKLMTDRDPTTAIVVQIVDHRWYCDLAIQAMWFEMYELPTQYRI